MIEELTIRNFAIIEELTLNPCVGFNVFTGETGAGKSMVIEATRFLFGLSAPASSLARSGAKRMEVMAACRLHPAFSDNLRAELAGIDIALDDEILVVRRMYDAETEKSKAYIQDIPVALPTLKKIGLMMIEIHGQGDAENLYGPSFAREYLDRWGGLSGETNLYHNAFRDYEEAKEKLSNHRRFVAENSAKIDFLRHNLNELEEIKIDPQALHQMETLLPLWMAKEQVAQGLSEINALMAGEEINLAGQVSRALALTLKLKNQLGNRQDLEGLCQNLEQAGRSLDEAGRALGVLEGDLDYDPARLEELLNLRARINRLLAKYKCQTTQELLAFKEQLFSQLSALENAELDEAALVKAFESLASAVGEQAAALSSERKRFARQLNKTMTSQIRTLGLDHATLELEVQTAGNPSVHGADLVLFWFLPNPGEARRELRQIASGGESSRIALVLRSLLIEKSEIRQEAQGSPRILILDEIEQGLSAEATARVAQKLVQISRKCQILAVTHSPILAAHAEALFSLVKNVRQGRTVTAARLLRGEEEKKGEILRLLGAVKASQRNALMPYVEKLVSESREKVVK